MVACSQGLQTVTKELCQSVATTPDKGGIINNEIPAILKHLCHRNS